MSIKNFRRFVSLLPVVLILSYALVKKAQAGVQFSSTTVKAMTENVPGTNNSYYEETTHKQTVLGGTVPAAGATLTVVGFVSVSSMTVSTITTDSFTFKQINVTGNSTLNNVTSTGTFAATGSSVTIGQSGGSASIRSNTAFSSMTATNASADNLNANVTTISSEAVNGLTVYTASISVFNTSRIDPFNNASNGVAVKGTASNNAANVGDYGEYVSSAISTSGNVNTTNLYRDFAVITISTGDWDLSAQGRFDDNGSGKLVNATLGISNFSGANSFPDSLPAQNRNDFTLGTATFSLVGISIPNYRVLSSVTTTYYLKGLATYTSGTPLFNGILSARRRR